MNSIYPFIILFIRLGARMQGLFITEAFNLLEFIKVLPKSDNLPFYPAFRNRRNATWPPNWFCWALLSSNAHNDLSSFISLLNIQPLTEFTNQSHNRLNGTSEISNAFQSLPYLWLPSHIYMYKLVHKMRHWYHRKRTFVLDQLPSSTLTENLYLSKAISSISDCIMGSDWWLS